MDEKDIKIFEINETNDERDTVVFQSVIEVEGQKLPTALITDNSVFSLIRVQIAPMAIKETNKSDLLDLMNEENAQYKPFKVYCDKTGSLLMDACLVSEDGSLNGDTVYMMFGVVINYLEQSYGNIMKIIWK